MINKQKKWLLDCLSRNENTFYAKKYSFQTIKSIADYQQQVPIISYQDIQNLITKISEGEQDLLFKGQANSFEITGGSVSGSKLIPYTEHSFKDLQKAIIPWFEQTANKYNLTGNNSYFSISPAIKVKQFTKSGLEIGISDDKYLGDSLSSLANSQIIPKWVSQLDNIKDWQIATIYYLITCPALEFISVWSPTFLLVLLDELDKEIEFYLNILENGLNLDKHFLNKNLDTYNRLKLYSKEFKTINLWSKIKLISCWADASSELFYEKLILRFPEINFQAKGLLSTEGIISAPDFDNDLLLTINSGFYEFICSKSANIYLADNLKENNSYEVIITTNAGLYRYKTGDIVRCKGYKNNIPIIKFQGRVGIISDITGEKLTEEFVAKSIQNIKYFCMLIADKINSKYIVVIDENNNLDINLLRNNIENNLRKNPQYSYARKINQLPKLSILKVEKPLHKYINYRLDKGDKVGDIKIPALSLDNWTNHK